MRLLEKVMGRIFFGFFIDKYLNLWTFNTIMESELKRIMNDLETIKSDIHQIKQNMPDKDMFLSSEESVLLSESFDNEKNGKLVSGKDLRKKLGL